MSETCYPDRLRTWSSTTLQRLADEAADEDDAGLTEEWPRQEDEDA